jgi:hypothetical protein
VEYYAIAVFLFTGLDALPKSDYQSDLDASPLAAHVATIADSRYYRRELERFFGGLAPEELKSNVSLSIAAVIAARIAAAVAVAVAVAAVAAAEDYSAATPAVTAKPSADPGANFAG